MEGEKSWGDFNNGSKDGKEGTSQQVNDEDREATNIEKGRGYRLQDGRENDVGSHMCLLPFAAVLNVSGSFISIAMIEGRRAQLS